MSSEFIKRFHDRPMSWSQISSFEYSPPQWYETYVLGKRQTSKELTFGSIIDKRFQEDLSFCPEIKRGEHLQFRMKVIFDGIPLVGIPDIFSFKKEKIIADLKTGKVSWNSKRANDTGQLTFYALLAYISYKIPPEDFKYFIYWLETRETGSFEIEMVDPKKIHIFETKRTMSDLLLFGVRIKDTIKKMEEYCILKSPVL